MSEEDKNLSNIANADDYADSQNGSDSPSNNGDNKVDLKQRDIGRLIADERKRAHERGYQKALSERGANLSHDDIVRAAEEAAQRKLLEEIKRSEQANHEQYWHNQGSVLKGKIEEATKKYGKEFEDGFSLDLKKAIGNSPALVEHLNKLSNAEDILNEFAKHPEKFASFISLNNAGLYDVLGKELSNLSKSYTKSGKTNFIDSDPVSEIRPSHVSGNELSAIEQGAKNITF